MDSLVGSINRILCKISAKLSSGFPVKWVSPLVLSRPSLLPGGELFSRFLSSLLSLGCVRLVTHGYASPSPADCTIGDSGRYVPTGHYRYSSSVHKEYTSFTCGPVSVPVVQESLTTLCSLFVRSCSTPICPSACCKLFGDLKWWWPF